jgi:hypothetical protein
MDEEGDGPSNRTKGLSLHPTSYEAQRVLAMVLDRLNNRWFWCKMRFGRARSGGTLPPPLLSHLPASDARWSAEKT